MTFVTHLVAFVPTFGDQREISPGADRPGCQCQVQPRCRTTPRDSRNPIYRRCWSSLCPPTSRTSSPSLFSRFVSPRRVSFCPNILRQPLFASLQTLSVLPAGGRQTSEMFETYDLFVTGWIRAVTRRGSRIKASKTRVKREI